MRLNQVTLYTEKTTATVEFYKKLGLFLIVDSLPRYARLQCPDGDSTLSVCLPDGHPTGIGGISIYFECENVDAEVEHLRKLDLEIAEEPFDRPWLWRQAYINDPNGNKVCLFTAGKNRLDPPWRIN